MLSLTIFWILFQVVKNTIFCLILTIYMETVVVFPSLQIIMWRFIKLTFVHDHLSREWQKKTLIPFIHISKFHIFKSISSSFFVVATGIILQKMQKNPTFKIYLFVNPQQDNAYIIVFSSNLLY